MESDAISMLDLAALNAAELHRSPFPFVVVPSFVKEEACAAIDADFPKIDRPGSIPVRSVKYGPAFETFLAEILGPEFAAALGAKLELDLVAFPTMITVRGLCRARDGQVHTDSKTKIVTVLIYLNRPGQQRVGAYACCARDRHQRFRRRGGPGKWQLGGVSLRRERLSRSRLVRRRAPRRAAQLGYQPLGRTARADAASAFGTPEEACTVGGCVAH